MKADGQGLYGLFERCIEIINKLIEYVIAVIMFVMVTIIIIQVIRRYIFGSSFTWPEELAGYLMVWVVFLGSSIALYRGEHIGLTFFMEKWFKKYTHYIEILLYLVLFVSLMILARSSWAVAVLNESSQSLTLGFSLYWTRLALPVGFSLMLLNLVFLILKAIVSIYRERREGDMT